MNVILSVIEIIFEIIGFSMSPKLLPKKTFFDTRSIIERIEKTKTYKSMYYILDGYQPIVMISDLKTAKELYGSGRHKLLVREYPYLGYVMDVLLMNSIGANYGKNWEQMKKPLTKFFTTQSVKNNFKIIIEETKIWRNNLFSNKTNVYSLQHLQLDILTIKIMSLIIYGKLDDENINELHELSIRHNKMMVIMGTDKLLRIPVLNKYLTTKNKTEVDLFWEDWKKFNDKILVKYLNRNLDLKNSLFEMMVIDERYSKNISEFYQTLYEIMLFNLDIMIDGFSNLIWNVSKNEGVKNKIYDEICKIDLNNLTIDNIMEMKYLHCVINESARLNPGIVSTFAEKLSEDIVLNGYLLKKGTYISLDTQMINRDESVWENPDSFDPSRFEKNQNLIYSFHRFGLSPRKCMGNIYADYILKIGLMMILSNNNIEAIDEKIKTEERMTIPNLSNYEMTNKVKFEKRQ